MKSYAKVTNSNEFEIEKDPRYNDWLSAVILF
jgi:hypothetical protein